MAVMALTVTAFTSKAQTKFSVGGDLISSYVWRGTYGAGTSVQPSIAFKAGSFSVGTWGSVDIAGNNKKEIDLTASYSFGNLSIGLTDYWWNGENSHDYFQFKKDASSHFLEANLNYKFKSGFAFSWNTMFLGSGDKYVSDKGKAKRAYSTYTEVSYLFSVGLVDLSTSIGVSPWNSRVQYTSSYDYATNGFAVTNIALKATKSIEITDKFNLPVFGQLIVNPATENTFLVFGVSL